MAELPQGEQRFMDVAEFRREGYLQELNRLFLHPLGLALEVVIETDGTERFGRIWDAREDPEGFYFAKGVMSPEKAQNVSECQRDLAATRARELGFVVQPVHVHVREDEDG